MSGGGCCGSSVRWQQWWWKQWWWQTEVEQCVLIYCGSSVRHSLQRQQQWRQGDKQAKALDSRVFLYI